MNRCHDNEGEEDYLNEKTYFVGGRDAGYYNYSDYNAKLFEIFVVVPTDR